MENNIKKHFEVIEEANAWIGNCLDGNKGHQAYKNVVNCRRNLKRKKSALEGNPAAALYGESQVGKSYLISSLLSEEGKSFGISDHKGKVHNFIENINPPGGGTESTSLVSRFSVRYKPKDQKFPVKSVLLSPADIILVLCDSFYNDINLSNATNAHFLSKEEINKEVYDLKEKYQTSSNQQNVFIEDDLLDIQDYFKEYFQKADKVIDSIFFDEISFIISKVNPNEWKDIFCLLWNKNETFTSLFNGLIVEFQKLDFAKEIFLPIESVLNNFGTLLDVERLEEMYVDSENLLKDEKAQNYTPKTKALLENDKIIEFEKSHLCALTAELVFSQPDELCNSKPFLKETDLLDFPGARSRLNVPIDSIENKNIPKLLLRGKVAYLFNKYSDEEKINILIFAAKHEQTAQRLLPRLINNWVSKTVGEDSGKRESFIKNSKISPLFVIGTFFNVNLHFDPRQDKIGDVGTPLKNRWVQRFTKTLAREYFEAETYSWFNNWTQTQKNFQNIYLLRDFQLSEIKNNLYRGYREHKKEIEEVVTNEFPNFRKELRQSFLDYDFVKNHFKDPEKTWDEAASINKDGAVLIIENLTLAANNINAARREKIINELNDIKNSLIKELFKTLP